MLSRNLGTVQITVVPREGGPASAANRLFKRGCPGDRVAALETTALLRSRCARGTDELAPDCPRCSRPPTSALYAAKADGRRRAGVAA